MRPITLTIPELQVLTVGEDANGNIDMASLTEALAQVPLHPTP